MRDIGMWKKILTPKERALFEKLDTPAKIQDHLNKVPFNFSVGGDTLMSPRRMMKAHRAQCIEGALFASAVLWYHGHRPLLLDLRSSRDDDDHVVALFKEGEYWGAISKTNHAVLRYRDPIYKSPRELAMSYFHEYFLNANGKKTLVHYSRPFSLAAYGLSWVVAEEDLWGIAEALDDTPHEPFVPKGVKLRDADKVERRAGKVTEWQKKA
jgi:hypothetical protein